MIEALDMLLGWGVPREWTGNLTEVSNEIRRHRPSDVSDYLIRQVLKAHGKYVGRGQYEVTHETFTQLAEGRKR